MKTALFALLLSFSLGTVRAAPPPEVRQDLAALLPQDTALFGEFDDLGGLQRWLRETSLGRICAEPEMQQFTRGILAAVKNALKQAQQGFNPLGLVGLTRDDFKGIRIRRAGFAIIDASLEKMIDGRAHVDVVLTAQYRAGAANGHKIMRALRNAAEMFGAVRFSDEKMGGRPVWIARVGQVEICVLADGDRFLLTTQRERMAQMIAALGAPYAKRLAASPRYQAVRRKMKVDRAAFFVYADVPRLVSRGLEFARRFGRPKDVAEFARLWNVLGLNGVEAAAMADMPAGADWRTEFAVTLSKRRGVFVLMQNGRVDHRFARHVPAGSLLYGTETFDLREFWPGIVQLAGEIHPTFRDGMKKAMADANAALGVSLEDDLFAGLGTTWAGYVGAPPGGGLLPDFGLFVTVRDKARLNRAIDAMTRQCVAAMKRAGGRAVQRKTAFRGMTLNVMELSGPDGNPIPFAPTWAVGEDFLVAGPFPHTVRNALMEKASLAGQKDFVALSRAVPEGAASATYLDTKALVGWLYNSVAPILQGLSGAINEKLQPYGLALNFKDLPPATVLTRHLTGTMYYTVVENDGVRAGWLSPFGSAGIALPVVAIGLVAAGAMVIDEHDHEEARLRYRLRRSRQQLKRESAKNRKLQARLRAIEKQIEELKKQLR